jgi:hypothetical protein
MKVRMRGGLLVGCYDGGALIRIRISTLQFPIGEANIYEVITMAKNERAYERREAKFLAPKLRTITDHSWYFASDIFSTLWAQARSVRASFKRDTPERIAAARRASNSIPAMVEPFASMGLITSLVLPSPKSVTVIVVAMVAPRSYAAAGLQEH